MPGELLIHPGLPEVVAVRDWACEQVTAQLAGTAPAPWPGADQERFTTAVHERVGRDGRCTTPISTRSATATGASWPPTRPTGSSP